MGNLQPMFPVYLPRIKDKDEDKSAYETAIAQNENNLNQNLTTLYQALEEILNRLGG